MDIKVKIFCKWCSDKFNRDKEMIVVQVDPKVHFYRCSSCNRIAFIQERFFEKEELESEKLYR
jgi:hypothetical protein